MQFAQVPEFPRSTGTVKQKQFLFAAKLAFLPVLVEGADVADEGCNSGDRGDQQVIYASALRVKRKASLWHFAHQHFIADLQVIEVRGQFAVRD